MSRVRDSRGDVTVQQGGPESLDRLEPLWRALHAHHQSVQPGFAYHPDGRSWELRRSCYVRWLQAADSFVLVAERHGRAVGYAFVEIRPGPDDTWVTGPRVAELQTLSVAPAARGQGIGTLLLDAVDEELERLGVGDLFVAALAANTGARRLYERRGLRPVLTCYARFCADRPEPRGVRPAVTGPGPAPGQG
ncbi:GNAT family N-acetyltransferase [Streptomyces sp. NPDC051132]|uniref:GNAT family N-acetyltransferase n=1 Tax=unclassified Streptomyces TaxID=2593676 RepID=UPI003442F7F3